LKTLKPLKTEFVEFGKNLVALTTKAFNFEKFKSEQLHDNHVACRTAG
jgi:hypothetical protein